MSEMNSSIKEPGGVGGLASVFTLGFLLFVAFPCILSIHISFVFSQPHKGEVQECSYVDIQSPLRHVMEFWARETSIDV